MYAGAALSFGLIRTCRSGLVLYCSVLSDAGGENDGSSAIFERSLLYPRRIANLTRATNGWSWNLKTTIFNKDNFNTFENVVCELSAFGLDLSAWLVDMIWRRCKYNAPCCCVFKIVVVCVKRRCLLYCSQARMRLRSPLCNYSVEALHNDVPGCVGMKTSRKTREIRSFSMTFSSDDFLCLEGYFQKRCILTPEVILS